MTVSDAVTSFRYEGNGVSTVFAYNNKLRSTSEVSVKILTRATDAVVETLLLGTDYSVTITSSSLANITVTNALKIPTASQDILLELNVGFDQTRSFPRADSLPAADIENGLDKLTMLLQVNRDAVTRSLRFPSTDVAGDAELPPRASRVNKALVFDASGDIAVSVDDYNDQAADAAASAAEALANKIITDANATAAAASASAASGSEANAAASAVQAAAAANGMKFRGARVASTANLTLSGAQTIDGVSAIAGDRVLAKNQTAPAENGIYVVAAGAWSRSSDMDAWDEIVGSLVSVEEGTAGADLTYLCTSNAGGTLGSTSISFTNWQAFIADGAVTNAKLANMNANTVKARAASSTGVPSDVALSASQLVGRGATGNIAAITLGTNLSMSGTTLNGAASSPLTLSYTSADQTITSSGSLTLAHGLGTTPFIISYILVCQTAEANYSVGNLVLTSSSTNPAADAAMGVTVDATNITIRFCTGGSQFWVPNKTTGVMAALTNANWRLRVKALA